MASWRRFLLLAGLGAVGCLTMLPYALPLRRPTACPADLADAGGRFVSVGGLQTYVDERGPRDGPAVLLLHGTGCATPTWRCNLAALAAAGLRVVAFDRPGSGLSDKPLRFDYSQAAQADFTVQLMDVLGIRRAVLAGHSAGGNVVLHVARRRPERVAGLVVAAGLVAIPGGPPLFVGKLLGLPPFARWVRVVLSAVITPAWAEARFRSAYADPQDFDPAHSTGVQRTISTAGWDTALIGTVRDSADNLLTDTELATVQIPTLVAWGAADPWVPPAIGERLRAALPLAEWRLYPQVGHFLMEEAATAFNADLLAFVRRQAG